MISYEKLWKVMKQCGVSQYTLIKTYHISPRADHPLETQRERRTHTIEMFCRILQCDVDDIMQYIPNGPNG